MPKRKREAKIEHYQRKIRKLQAKEDKRRRIIYTSSDESDKSDNENMLETVVDPQVTSDVTISNLEESNQGEGSEEQAPELDPDTLTALGETTEETPTLGPKIHDKLSSLWLPILRKGINKETKEKLLKKYPIPENCTLLQAPKLNPEISAAVTEAARSRDKEAVQQQLGRGIVALNKGLELLLDDGNDRLQAVKFLSNSCRLLCDLHHQETEARKRFITPSLDKSFLNIMQDVDRDELLYGNKLSDKIKATKVIEKHGLQIKKPTPQPKTPSTLPFTNLPHSYQSSRPRHQGNWTGPPRFPPNRGGRGGQRKLTAPTNRRTQLSSSSHQKPPAQPKKPRAVDQQ
ncbi:uncharacterized protein LOC113493758 [Trichoplusia ni]|uniref:Uncharacterized protein LOC113493758 n=1 Tax=Trichoplusia ni TaxID=7111 RepID=A0A7E5VH40_TRINI|nr:uncharacterized protein LOC113493758 [Trichoplusia ni]